MEPLLKKLGPTSWECVDSKLAWSRLVGRMMMTKMMTMMMIKMVTMMTKMTKMMTMMMMAEMMIFVRLSQKNSFSFSQRPVWFQAIVDLLEQVFYYDCHC